ncbi:DUF4920 domain-containing protein [Zunongwangia sp. SCSIO 43204]|uniref:DUF4920 domain-containing protein n=1 Tax=Zunongwangia sp. SCSIO 43204 TaxID=2779359 RepID=UPI001CA88441|nr:DUF4920 domain-containing protein [Zunongwangia sp. SCSIO 43204]UAB84074.1 DUF4920 domain-containing protein [Zunongwangia sp. SCSIO 43204]
MKKIMYSALLCCALLSCKNSEENKEEETVKTEEAETSNKDMAYASFGEEITAEGALDAATIAERYESLKPGDTISTSFVSTVNSVCKMKGCWMNLEIPGDEDVSVKFKDYGFFVPKDIEGKEVVVEGKAFLKEVSVEDQKHFAEDAGKSEEEIAAITEPKQELAFLANGVLLKQ